MAGNADKLSAELRELPFREPKEIFELLKAMASDPILDTEVQRKLCTVIFKHVRDCTSTKEAGLGLFIRSAFQQALDPSINKDVTRWISFTILEHEHESLLRTPLFLTLAVRSGSLPVVHEVLEKVRSSAWTIEEQRYLTYSY